MTAKLNKIESSMRKAERAAKSVDAAIRPLEQTRDFGASRVKGASQTVDGFNRKQRDTEKGTNRIETAWSKVKGVIAAVGITSVARKTIQLADTMTQTSTRIALMNDGLQTTEQLQNKIMASANRSRAAYTDVAATVSKLGILAGEAFKSNDEMIAFTELMNKNFVVGGAGQQEQAAGMYQLTQAMAAGKLQGDEFRSIMENAPLLAQAIADFTGKSKGELKEMSAQGVITADIIKGAMFASADQINDRFKAMPMTFAQVGTIMGNMLLQTFNPLIQGLGRGAQFIYDNWSTIAPVFWGVAAGALGGALAFGIWTAAAWLAEAANRALIASMLASPFLWIAVVVGIIVTAIYRWVQAVGGIQIAWLIACNLILSAADRIRIGFYTAFCGVQDYAAAMKVAVLVLLEQMINGAINQINKFIGLLNKVPGVSIDMIGQVTFGAQSKMEYAAGKQSRSDSIAAMQQSALERKKAREDEIASKKAEKAAQQSGMMNFGSAAGSTKLPNIGKVGSVDKIGGEVNIAEEDLKFLRDVAEMRYVQNFVTLTPTVSMNAQISEKVDAKSVMAEIERALEEEFVAAAEGVYA